MWSKKPLSHNGWQKKYKCGKCGRPLFKWRTDYEEVKKQDKKFIEKLVMAVIVLLLFAFGYWNSNGSGGYSKEYDHPHHSGNPWKRFSLIEISLIVVATIKFFCVYVSKSLHVFPYNNWLLNGFFWYTSRASREDWPPAALPFPARWLPRRGNETVGQLKNIKRLSSRHNPRRI